MFARYTSVVHKILLTSWSGCMKYGHSWWLSEWWLQVLNFDSMQLAWCKNIFHWSQFLNMLTQCTTSGRNSFWHVCLLHNLGQAGTSCSKLTSRLWGPTEFMRTKGSARVSSVGLRLSSFLGSRFSVFSPQFFVPREDSLITTDLWGWPDVWW